VGPNMSNQEVGHFPLFDKARRAGVLDTGNGLIVAPTATGKSYIGRAILRSAVRDKEQGVHAYLVPYRALASEMYDSLLRELNRDGVDAIVKVATGDHSDPIYPQETNILIATYERFAGIMRSSHFTLGRVVVDEVHLIADETRGPVVEGLIARMKSFKAPRSLCALSAVVSNPEELGRWLAVPVIVGDKADRMVEVEFCCEVADDVDCQLAQELVAVLQRGEQAIIFCRSKAVSQRVVRDLKPVVAQHLTPGNKTALQEFALTMAEDDEDAQDLLDLLSDGMAFHHAGLSRESRRAVETAFRERHLKAIACTPTLAAGVNLPARLVVVRDVFRTEFVRGFPHPVMLSTGELLNMLGRAGRPGQVESGRGVAFVKKGVLDKQDLTQLQVAIRDGRGNPVKSRLRDSFDTFMRFLLAVAADRGECTMVDLGHAVRQTLWYLEYPTEIAFERPLEADIMEDIPSYARVTSDMRVERAWEVGDGVAGSVVSGPKTYNFSLRFSGQECTCPAGSKWRRQEVCKHLACAIHHLLFEHNVDDEIRSRAIYAAAHRFRKTLDLGTKIREAVHLLRSWHLLEAVPGGFQATPLGILASNSSLDLLFIRAAHDRVRRSVEKPLPRDVAFWVVEDYLTDESKREKWQRALDPWLCEVDIKKIKLPEKHRGEFERGLETLGQVATLYGEIARSLGKEEVAEACRLTRGCLQYGVSPELIPLASLRIFQLGRARCRFLYEERNIRGLEDLAKADPYQVIGRHAPLRLTQQWVETARNMWRARNRIVEVPEEHREQEIDSFLATFQADQLSLFAEHGVIPRVTT
jgi:replicative superfamily II helicase